MTIWKKLLLAWLCHPWGTTCVCGCHRMANHLKFQGLRKMSIVSGSMAENLQGAQQCFVLSVFWATPSRQYCWFWSVESLGNDLFLIFELVGRIRFPEAINQRSLFPLFLLRSTVPYCSGCLRDGYLIPLGSRGIRESLSLGNHIKNSACHNHNLLIFRAVSLTTQFRGQTMLLEIKLRSLNHLILEAQLTVWPVTLICSSGANSSGCVRSVFALLRSQHTKSEIF